MKPFKDYALYKYNKWKQNQNFTVKMRLYMCLPGTLDSTYRKRKTSK